MRMSKFLRDNYGTFHGKIQGLGFGSLAVISEDATDKEGKPYGKLIADPLGDPYEVGRFWPKQKGDLKYYSVSFESPFFTAPINAALFPNPDDPNTYDLVWQRLKPAAKTQATNSGKQTQFDDLELASATYGTTDLKGSESRNDPMAKQPKTKRSFLGMQARP